MKLTKTKKNQHPKLYGYGTLEQLQSDQDNTQSHWILYKDADGDYRFIPCDEAYYHAYRNEERNERRVRDLESRCLIPSEKYGLVKCRADCSLCPKVRDGLPISIDYMREQYDFDFKDDSYEAKEEELYEQEQKDYIWNVVSELDPVDQKILKLFSAGKKDAEIAEVLSKSRSRIQERRVQLIELLREKLKKFNE